MAICCEICFRDRCSRCRIPEEGRAPVVAYIESKRYESIELLLAKRSAKTIYGFLESSEIAFQKSFTLLLRNAVLEVRALAAIVSPADGPVTEAIILREGQSSFFVDGSVPAFPAFDESHSGCARGLLLGRELIGRIWATWPYEVSGRCWLKVEGEQSTTAFSTTAKSCVGPP